MIHARIKINKDSLNLSIKGHAGAAEEGKDIVCASASILAYVVAQTITDLRKKRMLKNPPIIILRKGCSIISCKPMECCYDVAKYAFIYAKTGLELLQHNYPDYVSLTTVGKA